jgi:hypothetical protein
MGRSHVAPGTEVHYTLCPPATGSHYNTAGLGPIAPRYYTPDDLDHIVDAYVAMDDRRAIKSLVRVENS